MKKKSFSLKMKMFLYIGLMTFVSFAVTIGIVTVKAGNMARENAVKHTEQLALRYSGIVKAEIEIAMDAARTLALTFESFKESEKVPERSVIDEILKRNLKDNPSFLAVWTVWEPDALDGKDMEYADTPGHDSTGRYIPYWIRNGNNITVEPLKNYDKPGDGDYYLLAKQSGKETVLEPFTYSVAGRDTMLTSLCSPIFYKGKVVGVIGVDMSLLSFQKSFSEIEIFSGEGYLSMVSNQAKYLSHPDSHRMGASMSETDPWVEPFIKDIESGKGFVTKSYSRSLDAHVQRILKPIFLGRSETPWGILVTIPMKAVMNEADQIKYICIGIGSIALIIVMCTIFFIVNNITGSIEKGMGYAQVMADGDLSQNLEVTTNDEVGKLMTALNHISESLGGMIRELTSGVKTITSSSRDLAGVSEQMSQGAYQTKERTTAVASATEEMNTGMTSIAAAMEQATTNLSMVAGAAEEMTSSIKEVAANTSSARTIADRAVAQADDTSKQIHQLGEAAIEIGNVTETINDISEQTNLLALNATIEAARAGEAGKGFAVVAAEIKELARLTSESTNNIKEKITGIQAATSTSVENITSVSEIINEMNEISAGVAAAIEEQTVTTQEIAANVTQASQGLVQINENLNQSSGVSREIAQDIAIVSQQSQEISEGSSMVQKSANDLLTLSEKLGEMAGKFKI